MCTKFCTPSRVMTTSHPSYSSVCAAVAAAETDLLALHASVPRAEGCGPPLSHHISGTHSQSHHLGSDFQPGDSVKSTENQEINNCILFSYIFAFMNHIY